MAVCLPALLQRLFSSIPLTSFILSFFELARLLGRLGRWALGRYTVAAIAFPLHGRLNPGQASLPNSSEKSIRYSSF
jgi:hypothetical protein